MRSGLLAGLVVDGPRPAVEWVTSLPDSWLTSSDRHALLLMALDTFAQTPPFVCRPSTAELQRWAGDRSKGTLLARLARLAEPLPDRPSLLEVERGSGRRRSAYRLRVEETARLVWPDRDAGALAYWSGESDHNDERGPVDDPVSGPADQTTSSGPADRTTELRSGPTCGPADRTTPSPCEAEDLDAGARPAREGEAGPESAPASDLPSVASGAASDPPLPVEHADKGVHTADPPSADSVASVPDEHTEAAAALVARLGTEITGQQARDCVAAVVRRKRPDDVARYTSKFSAGDVARWATDGKGGRGAPPGPARQRCSTGALVADDGTCCYEHATSAPAGLEASA